MVQQLRVQARGWGFGSVAERLPRKRKALGSVPSSEKKNQKKKKKRVQATLQRTWVQFPAPTLQFTGH